MKKLTIIFAAIAVCSAVAANAFTQGKKGGGGSGTAAVYLNVTIDDGVSQQLYGIGSDGNGTYSNGQNSTSAQFTQYGFLDFNSGTRVVNAYYSTPVEGNDQRAADSGSGVTIKTHGGSNYLQNMTVGETRCVQTSVNFNLGDYTRTIGYNAGYGTISNTSYVKVTHPDTNNWIMESFSINSCTSQDGNSYDSIARVRDHKTSGRKAPDIDYGRYYMPLRLILTRQ